MGSLWKATVHSSLKCSHSPKFHSKDLVIHAQVKTFAVWLLPCCIEFSRVRPKRNIIFKIRTEAFLLLLNRNQKKFLIKWVVRYWKSSLCFLYAEHYYILKLEPSKKSAIVVHTNVMPHDQYWRGTLPYCHTQSSSSLFLASNYYSIGHFIVHGSLP